MKSTKKPAPGGAPKKTKKPSFAWKFIGAFFTCLFVLVVAIGVAFAGIVGGAIYGYIETAEPITEEQLIAKTSGKTTIIYDSKGTIIQKLTGKDNMDSEYVSDKEVPKYLKDAIISIEDERFESHNGIDIQGILNAGIGFAKSIITSDNSATRGGSTITQQVVKNITGKTTRSIERKVQEWYAAIQLEKKMEKWQILELYMNLSYWGNSCNGVQSASKKYFGKPVQQLDLAECALLAGITNSPGKYNPFTESGRKNAKERQEIILAKMLELGKINQTQYNQAIKQELVYASKATSQKVTSVQSYFVDQVIADVRDALIKEKNVSYTAANYMIYGGGLEIYTTLDPSIQADMDAVFMNDEYFPLVNKMATRQMEHPQAAMAIVDVQNGHVKALRGGYGKKEASNTLNRASSSQMKRQPGSIIKPIAAYAPAIDLKLLTPASIIDDVPAYMLTGNDAARPYPRNYDWSHDGLTTARNGLKNSVNVVAAKIWKDILGPDNSIEYLKRVGINRENEKYLSLVMGGLEEGVNPLQMAAAYVPFAHEGMYYEPTTFTLVLDGDGKEIINRKAAKFNIAYSEQTAFILTDMMKEVTKGRTSPYPHSGTAARYVNEEIIGMPVAGKTGTTSLNIDKWFVGYTPYYSAAVWYGYDNSGSEPIKIATEEYNQAQIIWSAVMKKVHEGLPQKDFEKPASGIVQKRICIYSGKIATDLCAHDQRGNATKVEYFIKGTEPRDDDLCTVHVEAQVCTESHDTLKRNLLAGPYCPAESVVNKVFIQRTEPYVPVYPNEKAPKDVAYELPAGEYCTVHGAPDPATLPGIDDLDIFDFIQWPETGRPPIDDPHNNGGANNHNGSGNQNNGATDTDSPSGSITNDGNGAGNGAKESATSTGDATQ
jgi:penicillin-binding protein 1A